MSEQNQEEVVAGPSSVPVVPVDNGVDPEHIERRAGWVSQLGRATCRERILHDIAPCDDEGGCLNLFKRISERIRNNTRGTGVMCAAAQLDGAHSHVHIVHVCNWNSTSCKDIFLQGAPIKKRQPRYNRWTSELDETFWRNLIDYLFGRGRR